MAISKKHKEHNKFSLPYHKKLSFKEKFASNGKWFDESLNHMDSSSGYVNSDFHERLEINYAIAKGKAKEIINNIAKSKSISNDFDKRLLEYEYHDILSSIYKSLVGEGQKRELHAIVKDISGYNQNLFKTKKNEYYNSYIDKNIKSKIRDKVTREVFQKHNINNPQDLKPEEQKEIQANIESQIKIQSPEDIDNLMNNKYKSPSETMWQEILDWYIKYFDLKFQTDEAFKHLILSGREIAYQNIENGIPVVKMINPKGFKYFSKDNTYFIGEGEWWLYEEGISYIELMSSIHGDVDIMKKIYDNSGLNNITDGQLNYNRRKYRGEADRGVNEAYSEIINNPANANNLQGVFELTNNENIATRRGQNFVNYLKSEYGYNNSSQDGLIRKTHGCYKAMDQCFLIEREDPNNPGTLEQFWVGENYETNRELDVSVTEVWVPAFYEATKIGAESNIVYNKKRCEFQNRSVNNPFDITSPYTGVEYSRLFNNAEHIAPIEFGIPAQAEYNHVKHQMKKNDKRDGGRAFIIPESFIPEDWSLEKFTAFVKETGIVPINENNSSLNPAIASQILKGVDLSTQDKQTAYINRLEYIKAEAQQQMSYSPSTLGQAPASITATNNQQNIIQGSYKTEDIFNIHSMFINRVLNNGMLMIKNALLLNKDLRNTILSIPSLAALKVDDELLFNSIPNCKVINTSNEVKAVNDVKNLLQPMIQNGVISDISDIIKAQFSKNSSELINLAEESERKVAEKRKEEQQIAAQEAEKNRKLQMDIANKEAERLKYEFEKKMEMEKYKADLDHDKWIRQTDADQNQIPDSVQKIIVESELKKEVAEDLNKIEEDKLELENKKLEASLAIAEMNNNTKEKIAMYKEDNKK